MTAETTTPAGDSEPTRSSTSSAQKSEATTSKPRRTVLYALHKELGGKMVDFAGWEMPVQYPAGIMAEHNHCREHAALFDVSHMGQLTLTGPDVAKKLESLVPADIVNLPVGKSRYTFFTNAEGGILDDLIVTNAGDYLYVVVNASMREQDVAHMKTHLNDVELVELSQQALIAIQGPKAIDIVSALCSKVADMTFMESIESVIGGVPARLSRLGYTGEDGFEISVASEHADAVARLLLSHEHCQPAGLGARDSLRLEAGLCLYGNDIDTQTTPVEASLLWAIQKRRRTEGGFPGDSIIQQQIAEGAHRKLVGIRPSGRVPARHGAPVCDEQGTVIGEVTSGGFGPTFGAPVAMGYVDSAHAKSDTPIMLSIRNKLYPAHVCALPFVAQSYKR